jgi:type IV secretory pathway VirB3-like protein
MINQEVKEFMGILLHVVIELLWKEEENMINVVGKSNTSNTSSSSSSSSSSFIFFRMVT